MNETANTTVEILKIITGFLSENSSPIVILSLIFICRHALSNFISRLTSLIYKKGDSEFGLNAVIPVIEERKVELKSAVEKPALENEDSEIVDKAEDENWFSEMHKALDEGRIDDAETAFNKYALGEKDQVKLERNKASYLYFKFEKVKDDSVINDLEELVRTAKTEASKFHSLMWLSFCLKDSMQNKKVIALWRRAAEETKAQDLITRALVNLADALITEDKSNEARKLLIDRLSIVEEEEQKALIYEKLSKIENSLGNKMISVYCKDKSLEYDPNNKDELFNSAYMASNEDIDGIAISNYLRLIRIDSNNSTALNNLGVQAQEAGLETKAVENYKKGSTLENTLALANQGYLLLGAGFTEEADEIAKKALKLENPHKNIHSLITAINEKKEEQNNKWDKLVERSRHLQKIIRCYTEQYFLGNSKALEGSWLANNIFPTTITITNDNLEAVWQETGGMLDGNTYTAKLTGKVTGSSLSGRYTRKENEDRPKTLLGVAGDTRNSCIGYIDKDDGELKLFSSKLKEDFSLCLSRPKG